MGEDNIEDIEKLFKQYSTGDTTYSAKESESVDKQASTKESEPEANIEHKTLELYITAEDYFSNPTQAVSEAAKNKFIHFRKLAEQGDPRLYLHMLVSCSE